MKDFLNQAIEIGDTIVYPNRRGSNLWMNRAEVINFEGNRIKVRRTDDGKMKTIERFDRVVVVTKQVEGLNANV